MAMSFSMSAGTNDAGRRLDRLLRKALPALPLSAIHRLLRKGAVLVGGAAQTADYRVDAGDVITVDSLPADSSPVGLSSGFAAGRKTSARAESSPAGKTPAPPSLDILFEGNGLLFLNKPAGLPAHGRESLEDLVLAYLAPKLPPSLSFRPGPLHRLDRPSSGVIAFSASIEGARFFSARMRERKIKKLYLALVEGNIVKSEVWRDNLARDGGLKKTFTSRPGESREQSAQAEFPVKEESGVREALTRVTPLGGNGSVTLILAEIETGRTHQIRAQAAARGHPLLGDKKYGGKTLSRSGFFLHAWRVELPEILPRPIEAPLPEYFRKKIRELFGRAFTVGMPGN